MPRRHRGHMELCCGEGGEGRKEGKGRRRGGGREEREEGGRRGEREGITILL